METSRPRSRERRDAAIHIRVTSAEQELIDRAARATGKSRSEFMLESAFDAARDALLDRVNFSLTDEQYRELEAIFDAPAPPNDALRELARRPAPWEKA